MTAGSGAAPGSATPAVQRLVLSRKVRVASR